MFHFSDQPGEDLAIAFEWAPAMPVQQIVGTMHHIGPVIITTTVTLSCGMLVTLLGNIPTAATFGMLCVSIFTIALISNLIVLPAMLITISRRIVH